MREQRAQRGQALVEFSLGALIVLGLVLCIIDMGRAGFMQHNLDSSAAYLAQTLARYSSGNSHVPTDASDTIYRPTPLVTSTSSGGTTTYGVDPVIQTTLAQAARVASGAFSPTSLSISAYTSGVPSAFSNGAVTITAAAVTGNASMVAPKEIQVTINATFKPIVGVFLGGKTMHLTASETAYTITGP